MQAFLQKVSHGVRAAIAYFKQNPTLYFLIFLNLIGFVLFMAGVSNSKSKAPVFLAEIVLITLTVSFFFFRGVMLEELEQHITDVEAHPGGLDQIAQDLARMGNAIVQLNETARELDQMKELLAEFESYKKGLSAIRQDTASMGPIRDEVATLRQDMDQIKSSADRLADLGEVSDQLGGLNDAINEAKAGREALAKSVIALKAEVQELRSQSERISSLGEEIKKLQDAGPAVPDLGDWKEKVAEAEQRLAKLAKAARTSGGEAGPQTEEWKAASEEIEKKLDAITETTSSVEERLKALDAIAEAAADESPGLKIAQHVEDVKKDLAEFMEAVNSEMEELGEELRRDMSSLKAQMEGASEIGDVGEAIANIREELAALRGKMKSRGGAVTSGAVDEDLRKEVEDLRKAVNGLAANQPNLEVIVDEADLAPHQDRTLVQCALRIKNTSSKPNEIVAVRAELNSGRDRMTPTSIREWIPKGEAGQTERKVFLPMTVLENTISDTVNLTVAGWPLERTQKAYAFRITVRDKAGNEFAQSLDVSPKKKQK
ncbi:MAG: hypothetical protein GXP25_20265 [Planctomycetes bacterium]|nr:hypothetical protein [Planctomycetota bacterium]